MEPFDKKQWKGNTGGSPWMQRALVVWFHYSPLFIPYFFMALIIPFYMIFNHKGYLSMYHYFSKRHGYSKLKSFIYVYINHFKFGQIIIDRFAMYAGKHFKFEIEGQELFDELDNSKDGFIQISSHVGNYELAGYSLKPKLKSFNVLIFGHETEQVMKGRRSMFEGKRIRMIPVAEDLSHIFLINSSLEDGNIVSIPGDRVYGSHKSLKCNFMGSEAFFPYGPFFIAAKRNVKMLAVFVMKKSSKTYHILIKRIQAEGSDNYKSYANKLAQSFASELEKVLRQYPTQWFNYYEFWKDE